MGKKFVSNAKTKMATIRKDVSLLLFICLNKISVWRYKKTITSRKSYYSGWFIWIFCNSKITFKISFKIRLILKI